MKYKFNLIQKPIYNFIKNNRKSTIFNQIICIGNNDNHINIFKNLMNTFNILRAQIHFEDDGYYSIDKTVDLNKIIVEEMEPNKFQFNYDNYLVAITKFKNQNYLIFHHIFIDAKSEDIIFNFLENSQNLIISESKYQNYEFNYNINKEQCGMELLSTNINLLNTNSYAIHFNNVSNIKKYCSINSLTYHLFFLGIIALTMHYFYNNDNTIDIFDVYHGRPKDYKNTIGFFPFYSMLKINIDKGLSQKKFFQKISLNFKSEINKLSESMKKPVIFNDVRKLNIFKKSEYSLKNGVENIQDIEFKFINDDKLMIRFNKNKFDQKMIDLLVSKFKNNIRYILSSKKNTNIDILIKDKFKGTTNTSKKNNFVRNDITSFIDIFQTVFNNNNIGFDDNFINLGGNSLMASQIVNMTKLHLNLKLTINDLSKYTTIGELFKHGCQNLSKIDKNHKLLFIPHCSEGVTYIDMAIEKNPNIENLSQNKMYHMCFDKVIMKKFSINSLSDLIKYHVNNILNLQNQGPYNFLTYCYGGTIAVLIIIELLKIRPNIKYNLVCIESKFNIKFIDFENKRFHVSKEYIKNYVKNFGKLTITCLATSDFYYNNYCKNITKNFPKIKCYRINRVNEHYIFKIKSLSVWKEIFRYVNNLI